VWGSRVQPGEHCRRCLRADDAVDIASVPTSIVLVFWNTPQSIKLDSVLKCDIYSALHHATSYPLQNLHRNCFDVRSGDTLTTPRQMMPCNTTDGDLAPRGGCYQVRQDRYGVDIEASFARLLTEGRIESVDSDKLITVIHHLNRPMVRTSYDHHQMRSNISWMT
jgi:hypothetical protein